MPSKILLTLNRRSPSVHQHVIAHCAHPPIYPQIPIEVTAQKQEVSSGMRWAGLFAFADK
jgi:hypothetical protein